MKLYRRLPALAKILLSRAAAMPLENSKLHFPLIIKVSIANLGKYIKIYFQNAMLHYAQLFIFLYTNTGQRWHHTILVLR